MNKNLFALLLAVLLAVPSMARITGTQPTSADIFCVGPSGAEVCVDASGNIVPTTTNDASLGSSSLEWSDVRAADVNVSDDLAVTDDATVTGDLFKTMVATVTVTADATISVAGACGGILRLLSNSDVTSNTTDTFTAPSSVPGCDITVVNVGNGTIKLDTNANFPMVGFPNVGSIDIGTNDVIKILSLGTKWIMLDTVANN